MDTIIDNTIARGWYESRGVRYMISNPDAYRAENAAQIRDNIALMHKRGTFVILDTFLARRKLYTEMNPTMFSAFCSCEPERLVYAIALLEDRMMKGETILKPLACLITLTRAIEHKFLRGRDKHTYNCLRSHHERVPPRTPRW